MTKIQFKKIAFTMYPAKNLNRARNFYEEILGLTVSKLSAGGEWAEYDLPQGGCFVLTSLAKTVEPSANAGGSVAFEVEDLDTLITQLKKKNVTFKKDIFHSPVCRMAVIIDSESNAVTLHELHKKS